MTPEDLSTTTKIAAIRIPVERKMQHIKQYKLIASENNGTLFYTLQQLITVCALLTNFEPPLFALFMFLLNIFSCPL